jgi:hypothetical protein
MFMLTNVSVKRSQPVNLLSLPDCNERKQTQRSTSEKNTNDTTFVTAGNMTALPVTRILSHLFAIFLFNDVSLTCHRA